MCRGATDEYMTQAFIRAFVEHAGVPTCEKLDLILHVRVSDRLAIVRSAMQAFLEAQISGMELTGCSPTLRFARRVIRAESADTRGLERSGARLRLRPTDAARVVI